MRSDTPDIYKSDINKALDLFVVLDISLQRASSLSVGFWGSSASDEDLVPFWPDVDSQKVDHQSERKSWLAMQQWWFDRRYESKDHGFVRMLFHKSLLENWIPAYRFVFMTKSPRWSPLPHNRRVFNCVAFATTTKYEVAESRSWLSRGEWWLFPPPWPHQHRLPFSLLLSPSLPLSPSFPDFLALDFFFPPLSGSGSTWNRAWRMRIWSSGPAVRVAHGYIRGIRDILQLCGGRGESKSGFFVAEVEDKLVGIVAYQTKVRT